MYSISHLQGTRLVSALRSVGDHVPTRVGVFCRLLLGKLRRPCLLYFKKRAALEQGAYRHGHCRQCADCCRLLFRCPFLSADNLCMIYQSKVRPRACAYFPIDPRDLQDVMLSSGRSCGYWFTSDASEKPEP